MSATTIARLRATSVFAAPIVLLAALVYHPHVGDPLDAGFLTTLGAAVAADTTRWAVAHLATAVGSGLMILAFFAIRSRLRDAGEERWSAVGLPLVVMGSVLYAVLPGMEFAPLAAAETGGDVAAAQGALLPWFVPVLVTGALLFAAGAVGFAVGLARSEVLSPGVTRFVVGALVVMAAARFAPVTAVQFYVHGVAAIAALWPLGYESWKHAPRRAEGLPRPVPTT
jgi:hypothetical protein